MDELYQERILKYATDPKNKKLLSDCFCAGQGDNPSCGDKGTYFCKYDMNTRIITQITFDGEGCAISQAGMSILAEIIENKDLYFIKSLLPKDIYDIFGVRIGPARALCAMLCYNALQNMIKCIEQK